MTLAAADSGSHRPQWSIPDDWAWTRIEEVTLPVQNVDPKRRGSGTFTYIDLSAISGGNVVAAQTIPVGSAPSRARQLTQPGDTIYSCVRVYLKNIAFITREHDTAIASTAYCVLRPGPAIDPRYLYWFVNSQRFMASMLPLQRGNSPPAVVDGDVKAQEIPIPPLAEQQRIVARIDELFAEIAEGEAALERARRDLDIWRRALLKAAVTGELTRDWRDETRLSESGAALLERIRAVRGAKAGTATGRRGRLYEAPPPDLNATYELPSTWTWASVGELFDVFTGSTPSRSEPSYWNGPIPWVSSGEVAFSRIKRTRERITAVGLGGSSTRLHPPGTVLMAMIGEGKTRGQCAILDIEATNNQNAAAIRVAATPIPSEYVYIVLEERYHRSRRESQGGNQPALNAGKVASIPLPIPPLDEMTEIVRVVEEARAVAGEQLAAVDEAERRCRALRQSILKAAFEGRLVAQDTADEPASELLARVRNTAAELPAPRRGRSRKDAISA